MPHLHYWARCVETFFEEFDLRGIIVDAFESYGLRSAVRVFYARCIPSPERPHGWLRNLLPLFKSIVRCTRFIISF